MDVLARRLAAESPQQFGGPGEFALGRGISFIASTTYDPPQADAVAIALAPVCSLS